MEKQYSIKIYKDDESPTSLYLTEHIIKTNAKTLGEIERELHELMKDNYEIKSALVEKDRGDQIKFSKNYDRDYFNQKIDLFINDIKIDTLETFSLRQDTAEAKLAKAMLKNPNITHGIIWCGHKQGFKNTKELNKYHSYKCTREYLSQCVIYEDAFKEYNKNLANSKENSQNLDKDPQEKEFQKFIEDNIKLSNKIIEFEKKENIYLPQAKTRIFKEIANDISKLDNTFAKNSFYFSTKCDLSKVSKPKEIIAKFVHKNKKKVHSQTK